MNIIDLNWTVLGERQLGRRLAGVETALTDFRPPLRASKRIVRGEIKHQFASEGTPPWPPLKKRYAARKLRLHGVKPMMVVTGTAKRSLLQDAAPGSISKLTKTELVIGSAVTVGERRRWNLLAIHQQPAEDTTLKGPRPTLRLRESAQSAIVSEFRGYIFRMGEGRSTYS